MHACGLRLAFAFGFGLFASPIVTADISMSLDILDSGDPGGPAPAGLVVVDVAVDVSNTDWFVAGAIYAETANGAQFVYASGAPPFRPPGLAEPFVSFGSAAYGRDSAARFAPAGTIAEQSIALAGSYIAGGSAIFLPTYIDVGFFSSPVASPSEPQAPRGRDGYVMRIALDVSGVAIPGADNPEDYRIFAPGSVPNGYEPVLISDPEVTTDAGTIVGSLSHPSPVGQNWGLYVPEPGTLVLFLAVGVVVCRRRSTIHGRNL